MIIFKLSSEGAGLADTYFTDVNVALQFGLDHAYQEFGSKYVGAWSPPDKPRIVGGVDTARKSWYLQVKNRKWTSSSSSDECSAKYWLKAIEIHDETQGHDVL